MALVMIGCADPAVAAAAEAVVVAAGATSRRCDDPAVVAASSALAAAVVLDAAMAAAAATAWRPGSVPLVLVTVVPTDASVWALGRRLGARAVVALPDGESMLLDLLLGALNHPNKRAVIVGVHGATGGCGASTLAVQLAVTSAAQRRTALVDLDFNGGGIDLLCGLERSPGARWPDLAGTDRPRVPPELPVVDGLVVLSSDRRTVEPPAAAELLATLSRLAADFELAVLDLPRGCDPELFAACSRLVLICPRQVRAAAAAAALVQRGLPCDPMLLAADARPEICGPELAAAVGLPLAGNLPTDRRVPRRAATGRLHRLPRRSRLAAAARRVERSLAVTA